MMITRGWDVGGRVKMFFKNTNLQLQKKKTFWRFNAQYGVYEQQFCIIIIKLSERLDLNLTTKKRKELCDMIEMPHIATVIALLQYKNVSNQHVAC